MINNIDEYLLLLRKEMTGCDRAIIQDALSDAEEYLRNALQSLREKNPEVLEKDALVSIVNEYGTPDEIAAAYRRIEPRTFSHPSPSTTRTRTSLISRFFGIVVDPRAWGSLFFLLITFVTGIVYFTWAVTGLSLSLGLLILIVGIPLAALFLLSVRGLALVEGRLVEALTGILMPRRQVFSRHNPGVWGWFRAILTDKYTWFSLFYLVIQMPLGIIYFTLFVSLFSVSAWLVTRPVLELGFGSPAFLADVPYYTPGWLMPLAVIGGVLLFFASMHLAKWIGRLHGHLAKAMLVRR